MPTPTERYQHDLMQQGFVADAAQAKAVEHTQRLFDELLDLPAPKHSWWQKLLKNSSSVTQVQGLYFWGGVGRGKTYLVDNFYACLPFEQKQRVHFHHFMRNTHEALKKMQQQRDPLPQIAHKLAQKTRVLCLDEFHVSDITDAMILSGLLHALFEAGVVLIATSNRPPDDLYKSGLQRERFLPAIALLKQHLEVVQLDFGVDYRLRALEQAPVYFHPLDDHAEQALAQHFQRLSPDAGEVGKVLEINGREIPTVRCGDGVVWLDFRVLCNIPRAVNDYIELAKCFNTVLLSHVPQMFEENEGDDDFARRLIELVDEFYDRNVKLIISASVAPEALYQGSGSQVTFAFQRTVSRLQEMRSHEYLQRAHRC